MRTRLGFLVLLAAVVLGGCGDETKPRGEADKEPRGVIDAQLVEMVTETAVGGMVAPGAVALTDVVAVQNFSGQFEDDRMETKLAQAFAGLKVPDDKAAYAAVVGIGCDVPPDVVVTSTDSGILIEGTKSTEKPVECFAPMTSVAIVLVDESVVG
jgi:hypothetical protein